MINKRVSTFFFIAFFSVVALFLIVRNVGEQKNVTSHAAGSSTLTFSNAMQTGNNVTVDVTVNPGTSAVSLINLTIDYDNTKLMPAQTNGFAPNTTAFPATLDGPVYNTCNGTQCSMYIALSIGSNPTNAITTATKVATLNFQAVTTGNTQLTFDPKTQIYSIAAQDQANQNVLSTASPIMLALGGTGPIGTATSPIPGTTTAPGVTNATGNTGPTPIVTPGTTINLQLGLPGIGALTKGNTHPLHPLRTITFYLYNVDTNTLLTKTNSVVFDGNYFVRPVIDLGNVPNGNYQVFIQTPQYLIARLSQGGATSTIAITNGQAILVSPNTLIGGDIAPQKTDGTYGDNILDVLDYNALLSCYGNKAGTQPCTGNIRAAADLDDNGIIDAIDYNILLRGLALTHMGDTIPGNPTL